MPVRVVENRAAMNALLRGPNGAVARDLARRAIRVTNQAKINATDRPGPRVDTGRLRSSITWEIRESRGATVARIGTNVEYGFYLETGLTRNGRRFPFLQPALSAARF